MEPLEHPPRPPAMHRFRRLGALAALLAVAIVLAGCDRLLGQRIGGGGTLPPTVCGGIEIAIEGALPCERVAEIAFGELARLAPQQAARPITSVEVFLSTCPRGEVPPQIECGDAQFAQMVTFTFGDAGAGGPMEPSLTVAIEPVTGRFLGISNPLIL